MRHAPARPTNKTGSLTVRRGMLAVVKLNISKNIFVKFFFILKVLARVDFRGFVR